LRKELQVSFNNPTVEGILTLFRVFSLGIIEFLDSIGTISVKWTSHCIFPFPPDRIIYLQGTAFPHKASFLPRKRLLEPRVYIALPLLNGDREEKDSSIDLSTKA
jgi:hypothetical protein